jgi:hypothetical protein
MCSEQKEKKNGLDIVFFIPNILEMKPEGREPAIAPVETKDSIQSQSVMMTLSLVVVCRYEYVSLKGPTSAQILPPRPPLLLQKSAPLLERYLGS